MVNSVFKAYPGVKNPCSHLTHPETIYNKYLYCLVFSTVQRPIKLLNRKTSVRLKL